MKGCDVESNMTVESDREESEIVTMPHLNKDIALSKQQSEFV